MSENDDDTSYLFKDPQPTYVAPAWLEWLRNVKVATEQEHKGVSDMSENRPRVTAGYIIESVDMRDYSGASQETPHVEVRVEFDLHDHEVALRELDRAVESVRSQIKEAS